MSRGGPNTGSSRPRQQCCELPGTGEDTSLAGLRPRNVRCAMALLNPFPKPSVASESYYISSSKSGKGRQDVLAAKKWRGTGGGGRRGPVPHARLRRHHQPVLLQGPLEPLLPVRGTEGGR